MGNQPGRASALASADRNIGSRERPRGASVVAVLPDGLLFGMFEREQGSGPFKPAVFKEEQLSRLPAASTTIQAADT